MNSSLESILCGVIANCVTGLIPQLNSNPAILNKLSKIETSLRKNPSLSELVSKALGSGGKRSTFVKGGGHDDVKAFFASPELFAITRKLISTGLIESDNRTHSELKNEFQSIAHAYISSIPDETFSQRLFDDFAVACQHALQIAIDAGFLTGHEAMSAYRHRLLMDELSNLRIQFQELLDLHKLSILNVDEFVKKFKKQALAQCKTITPPSFDAPKKIPIDKIYVPPKLQRLRKQTSHSDDVDGAIDLPAFMRVANRAVILGMPGGGKSTLTLKISHLLLTDSDAIAFGRTGLVPILIALRKYAAEKNRNAASIVDYMEIHCNTELQFRPPSGSIELLLKSGRAVVLFDGLDELIDTSDRRDVSDDVESFCNLFPDVPVIVTSREVGYDQAPLNEAVFQLFRLAPFTQAEIHKYVKNWFDITDLKPDVATERSRDFLSESRSLQDLCGNPLMLALMCSIFRGERYLPKNRPELYAKCAEMLFERWDKSRGIKYILPFESLIRPAMNYLAHWIYNNPALASSGVPAPLLISQAAAFLYPRRFEDPVEAENAARQFIEFCAGRAWVFTDIGTTANGDSLYQFTHRTFLEYFAAAYIARSRVTPGELLADLVPHIALGEWDVVAQLAIQIHHTTRDDGDQLITGLLKSASLDSDDKSRSSLINFSLRCLAFLVPTPAVTRVVLDSWLKDVVTREKAFLTSELAHPSTHLSLVDDLFSMADENRTCAADQVHKTIEELSTSNPSDACIVITLLISLTSRQRRHSASSDFWIAFANQYAIQNSVLLRKLAQRDFVLCRTGFYCGIISVSDIFEWFGVTGLFKASRSMIVGWIPIAAWLLTTVNNFIAGDELNFWDKCFRGFGQIAPGLIDAPRPWTNYTVPDDYFKGPGTSRKRSISFTNDDWFVLFALTACLFEPHARASTPITIGDAIPFKEFKSLYIARSNTTLFDGNGLLHDLAPFGFSEAQGKFVQAWVQRTISLSAARSIPATG